jgi:replicative DNA helicase Mcm
MEAKRTVEAKSVSSVVNDFLLQFEKGGKKVYLDQIAEMAVKLKPSIVIDFADIQTIDTDLAVSILKDPERTLKDMKHAVLELLMAQNAEFAGTLRTKAVVRISNLNDITPIREVNVSLMGKLFAVAGAVTKVSERKNIATVASFVCANGHVSVVVQEREDMEKPERCDEPECTDKSFTFDEKRSVFADYQKIRIQELGDDLPPGQIPRGYDVVMLDDLIDSVRPGDHVIVTGLLKAVHEKAIASTKSRVFSSEIECNYAEARDKESESSQLTSDDVAEIKRIAESPDAYTKLVSSIAPAILGMEHIKESILLQLAGGISMAFPDGTRRRGEIHVCLIGEPGVAKSEILQFTSKVAPRSVLASGKSSSAAGLSAAIVKGPNDIMYLEIGVLPMADQGIAIVDEFDKIRTEDKSALHEGMEQSTLTVNKAGFHMTLNTRTSVLAALNPVGGLYDSNLSLMENVKIPAPLLSRFDLITVLLDRPTPVGDMAIAKHILSEHMKESYESAPPIPLAMLKKYLTYVRLNVKPRLMPGKVSDLLADYYGQLRKQSEAGKPPVTIRVLESLIRLSTARAKILLHTEVQEDDAVTAITLMQRMLKDIFTDAKTGVIDTGTLAGISAKDSQATIAQKALRELSAMGGMVERRDLKDRMIKAGLDEEKAEKMVKWLNFEGRMFEVKPGYFKMIGQ